MDNDKILEYLKPLADKLGETAMHLWQVALHQARIDAMP